MTIAQPGRKIVSICVLTFLSIALIGIVFWNELPRTCEIRIDCGDVRYSVLGIEIERRLMTEPARSVLLSLSDRSDVLAPEWEWIPIKVGTNRVPQMCRGFYAKAAAWSDVHPDIAVAVLLDVARYIKDVHATHNLPDSVTLLHTTQRDDASYVVEPSWTSDEEILLYLQKNGFHVQQELKPVQPELGR